MKLYGIPNCTTVKKARAWLEERQIAHTFHDIRKNPLAPEELDNWIAQIGWEDLLNRRGTTWRKLDPAIQATTSSLEAARQLMLNAPSIIKRPILDKEGRIYIGFTPEQYETLFQ